MEQETKEGDMKKLALTALVLALVIVLMSCAPGPNDLEKTANAKGRTAGFLLGLWHGLISPVTFVISIFSRNVRFYEVHNTGGWYNFGFVLGAGLFLSGGILGKKKRKN
jgi:hypothetical protein